MSTLLVVSNATGLTKPVHDRLTRYGYSITQAADMGELVTLDIPEPPKVTLIDAHQESDPNTINDMIRAVLGVFEGSRIFVIHSPLAAQIIPQDCFKAGAHAIFSLPFEYELLINSIFESAPINVDAKNLDIHALTKISVAELEQIKTMPIDVYICLPANKKILTYRKKDTEFEAETIKKFSSNPNHTLYIKRSDLPTYRQLVAKKIKDIMSHPELKEREKADKLRTEVGALLNGFFSTKNYSVADSRASIENLRVVMNEYIASTSQHKDLYRRITQLASQQFSNFNHSVNVSTYAGLFGLVLGYDIIEPICLAGLLHDIGLSLLPHEIALLDEKELSRENLELYKKHTQMAVDLIKQKGLPVSPDIETGILQHHENMDGSGYLGLKEADISPIAKIVALADAFDDLTSVKAGQPHLTPAHALMRLAGYDGVPRSPKFSPDFHGNLLIGLIAQNDTLTDKDIDRELLDKSKVIEAEKSLDKELKSSGAA